MPSKVYCPVCQVNFPASGDLQPGTEIMCPVCGARLEITSGRGEIAQARRYPQDPRSEIYERVDNFARLRGYEFRETKELVMDGLLEKHQRYGDFYCPCRLDNIPEHVCPCLPTRSNEVKRLGHCL